jgi:hypothetical protein
MGLIESLHFDSRKSRIRARVERAFGVMQGQFGFRKVRYKGLAKNARYLFTTCALINLVMAKEHLLKTRLNARKRRKRAFDFEIRCRHVGLLQLIRLSLNLNLWVACYVASYPQMSL